ncbi:MAG: SdiA-regulated domain-containing protein [Flavobacteriales bacterium]|nr:SdiA-regulated domain-containing protein [Flavobacteriales bacterium]
MRPPLLLAFLLSGCATAQQGNGGKAIPYEMRKPEVVFELPPGLREVSALTDVDEETIACVQDENASIYFLSTRTGRIVDSVQFAGPADMEGLTRVGDEFFALRSDGLIYRLGDRTSGFAVRDTFRIGIPNRNIEGLGYDERTGMVLVSPKDFVKGSKEGKDERVIHAIDPQATTKAPRVILRLSLDALERQAAGKGIAIPREKKGKGKDRSALKLRYSSVAVHPATGHYYLLSAVDRTLLVVDRSGELVDLVQLDQRLLPKPEGITFMPNGDMWLSSEGKGRTPVLVRYAMLN